MHHPSGATSISVLLAAATLAACSGPPAGAPGSGGAAPLDATVHIQLGRTGRVDGGRLTLTFAARLSDSRCPANAVCVWQGDAAVRIVARVAAASVDRELHTGVEPHSLAVDRYVVTVVGLTPYPGTELEGQPAAAPTVLLRVTRP